mmetsp:Transcript_77052/g.221359  ORF Transcript_77052/g.221359 Transcript_77052/m.221359 type:complete len:95 (-) Transcript_77052:855-1139(-)
MPQHEYMIPATSKRAIRNMAMIGLTEAALRLAKAALKFGDGDISTDPMIDVGKGTSMKNQPTVATITMGVTNLNLEWWWSMSTIMRTPNRARRQ